MKSQASICPVPAEQQPLNEYQELRDSGFFSWATFDLPKYMRKLLWTWAWSWAIAGPIAAASFSPSKHLAQFLLAGAGGASLFLALTLLRLYLGWSYVQSRLFAAAVFYEESGWYDGQLWSKPPEVITQDRLVVTYQVQPIMRRIKRTFAILALILLGGVLLWNLV